LIRKAFGIRRIVIMLSFIFVFLFSNITSGLLMVNTSFAQELSPNGTVNLNSAVKIPMVDPSTEFAMTATGLSEGKTGLLYYTEPTTDVYEDYYKVADTDGSIVFTKYFSDLMGARADNISHTKAYAIAGGKSVITWEGIATGCDQNTNNMIQFVILDENGGVIKEATDISTQTAPYNCYTGATELSNGNIAFFWQHESNEYYLRIFDASGNAVTSPTSITKTGSRDVQDPSLYPGVSTHSIAANDDGTFMVVYHANNNPYYYGVLYNNDGTQKTVNGYNHFKISDSAKNNGASNQVVGLSNNNFAVMYRADSDQDSHRIKIFSADGAPVGSEITSGLSYNTNSESKRKSLIGMTGGGIIVNDIANGVVYAKEFQNDGTLIKDWEMVDNDPVDWTYDNYVFTGYDDGFGIYNDTTGNTVLHGIIPLSDEKAITSFKFSGLTPEVSGTINEVEKTIDLTVPHGTDVTALVPTVVHTGVSVSPDSGAAQNFTNPVVFTITAEDNSTVQYTVDVSVENNAPIANADTYSTNENEELSIISPGVLVNDVDNDNDELTAVLVDGPTNGTMTLESNGSFLYTPNTDFYGTDSFTYKAIDGQEDSNVAPVSITVNDMTPPTVDITSSESDPTNEDPIPVTISFSKEVQYFELADITIGNGNVSGDLVTNDNKTYTVSIMPTTDGIVTVDVAEDVVEDHAGNGNIAATQYTIEYDGTRPMVSITSAESSPTNTDQIPVTISFSEEVQNLELADITVANGNVSGGLNTYDNKTYTANIISTIDGPVNVDVAENVAHDPGGNGNMAATSFTIIYDNSPPLITLNGDTSVQVRLGDSYNEEGATATDNIDGDITQSITIGGDTVDVNTPGTYIITYYVSDLAGNAQSISRTVEVFDGDGPIITLAGDSLINHEVGTSFEDPGATAWDNNNGDLTADITVTGTVNWLQLGTYELKYNVTDSAGNAAIEKVRTVHVVDTTAPAITLKGENPMFVAIGDTFTDPGATAWDNHDGNLTDITVTGSVYTQQIGHYNLTYIVYDQSGNKGSVNRTVTVYDNEIPVISLVGEQNMTLEVGTPFVEPGVRAWDNQDGDISNDISVTGDVYHNQLGTYILRYNVFDAAGNSAIEQTRSVEVVDTTAPAITILGNNPLTISESTSYIDPGVSVIDNYDGDLTHQVDVTDNVNPTIPGTYHITYKATDSSGNEANSTRVVHVLSNNATLKELSLSVGELNPTFSSNVTEYNAQVPNSVNKVTLTARANSQDASISINNAAGVGTDFVESEVGLKVGLNTIIVEVSAQDGSKVTYIVNITRKSIKSKPPKHSPKEEEITVDVEIGEADGDTLVTQIIIKRMTDEDGNVLDEVALTKEVLEDTIQNLIKQGKKTVRVVIPDDKDVVSEVKLNISKELIKLLSEGQISLEIYTVNAYIIIPSQSLVTFSKDIDFRIIPFKEKSDIQKVEKRIKEENVIEEVIKGEKVSILGRPVTIETNLQNYPIRLVLPLRDSLLENNADRQNTVNNMAVFIEHSDGTKELIQGSLVSYSDESEYGVQFDIDKFSTFSIVENEGLGEYFATLGNEKKEGIHKPYITGFDDKTFRPSEKVTRAQMAAMLARNLGVAYEGNGRASYQDISDMHWAFNEIEIARQEGIMGGYADGNFGPQNTITRAQMAVIADRWIRKQCEADQEAYAFCKTVDATVVYTDVPTTYWAHSEIMRVQTYGIMTGYSDNTFNPEGKLTRAEAVKVLNRLFKRGPLFGVEVPTFADVSAGHWAFNEIEEAAQEHQWKNDDTGKEILK
jgi:hypothetical protein